MNHRNFCLLVVFPDTVIHIMAPEISLVAEPLFHIGTFPVTNSLLLSTIAMLIIVGVVVATIQKGLKNTPNFLQNALEIATDGILSVMEGVLGSRKASEKYFPLVASIFFFVLISNWLGLLPGVGSVLLKEGESHFPLFRAPGADLNFTLGLGVAAIVAVHIIGVGALGIKKHVKKFINFSGPIAFFVGILEFISEFAKMVSFSFRLFGNVFAGEVLLVIVAFLVPYLVPLPFLFLEIFVGFVQALIFSMLTVVFVGTAIAHESH